MDEAGGMLDLAIEADDGRLAIGLELGGAAELVEQHGNEDVGKAGRRLEDDRPQILDETFTRPRVGDHRSGCHHQDGSLGRHATFDESGLGEFHGLADDGGHGIVLGSRA